MDQKSPTATKIVFFGTPDFARSILEALHLADDIEILAVVTQPDRPCGRGQTCRPGPVKRYAVDQGYPILQPASLSSVSTNAQLARLPADFFVVAAYGLLLPQPILDIPRHGCLNVHASLLPRHRGASPIQAALLHGDKATGISIMRMVAALDAGPVLLQRALAIGLDDTALTLHDQLAVMGGRMIVQAIRGYLQGRLRYVEQEHDLATYAPKLTKDQGEINWRQPASNVHNHIRAVHPWPGAFFHIALASGESKKITVHPGSIGSLMEQGIQPGTIIGLESGQLVIACLDRAYHTPKVHPADAKVMDARAFACGYLRDLKPGQNICAS